MSWFAKNSNAWSLDDFLAWYLLASNGEWDSTLETWDSGSHYWDMQASSNFATLSPVSWYTTN